MIQECFKDGKQTYYFTPYCLGYLSFYLLWDAKVGQYHQPVRC